MTQKTILLAEDDPAHSALIERALSRVEADCRLEIVRDGVEVIDYLFAAGTHAHRDPADMPDLLLLDLKMPKMDGLQVLQVLRRVCDDQRRIPPIVILTSSTDEIDIIDAYRLGAYSFIRKPAGFQELVTALQQIVSYWLGLNAPVPVGAVDGAGHITDAPQPGFLDRRAAASRRRAE